MHNLSQNLSIFIWHFLKHYKWKVYGIYLTVFIGSFLVVINPYLLKLLIDKIINNDLIKLEQKRIKLYKKLSKIL